MKKGINERLRIKAKALAQTAEKAQDQMELSVGSLSRLINMVEVISEDDNPEQALANWLLNLTALNRQAVVHLQEAVKQIRHQDRLVAELTKKANEIKCNLGVTKEEKL